MKYILAISLLLLISTTCSAATLKKWGYIAHYSRITSRYIKHTLPRYDCLSMSGFVITKNGTLTQPYSALYRQVIHTSQKHSLAFYPLITFKNASTGHSILTSPRLYKKTVKSICGMVQKNAYQGIHIDFEYLPSGDRYHLQHFLQLLKKHLHGTKITMAVFPQIDFPEKWSRFHDPALLAGYLDEIVLMCYDMHNPQSGPGPVTDIYWAERNIKELIKHMAPEKIWLGVPAYGYLWKNNKTKIITAKHIPALSKKFSTQRDKSGTLKIFSTRHPGIIGYYADNTTRALLARLATKYKLAGTALWRLGFE